MSLIDPKLFLDEAVSAETQAFNRDLAGRLGALPDQWSFPPAVIRERRAQGLGPFPMPEKSPYAETIHISGPHGDIPLRLFVPAARRPAGAYLHIHGGGWTLGSAENQDPRLEEIVERTGLAVLSVDYRLAPEHPYPQGPDDCEAAALWLVSEGAKRLNVLRFAIGGDSAGANLAAATLIRMRDRHLGMPFQAAIFECGCFDLSLTPSARSWGSEKLVLNTRDITMFVRHYLAHGHDAYQPDISPLYADLRGLPPAHFAVGTRDPLLDDTLFMAARWQAAGNQCELAVYPGGCHVFQQFALGISRAANEAADAFLSTHAASAKSA
ncbi:alpha/beta hydrolase [Stappia sp. F7233]|uniref:Alpha/beta hydrolase n=1 Tax=Stappia albiluteola TaxID=2758565 RepID=A0A839AHG3_9HYPH|nr:alpha/beta hydrolase [Stappia albiluteola]MBA5779143.1 alpha/beta hydrolase [Stappia albiluteola]